MSASGSEDIGMRLNQYPADQGGGPGGGQQKLASTPAQKKAAADALQENIKPQTKTAGHHADEGTSEVVRAFDAKDGYGWFMSSALKKAHKTWGEQMQAQMNRLHADQAALLRTNVQLSNTDLAARSGVQSVHTPSIFDKY
ncbi:hypothetical protein ABZ172_19245 [Streptomyces sp. NPDC006296]|uniref:hypothetical protein n=1 Tax=Streptomyces sp. NPDC006296 TaxID=3156746 RepID=UPI0033AD45D1